MACAEKTKKPTNKKIFNFLIEILLLKIIL
jgi:hypothetical protein